MALKAKDAIAQRKTLSIVNPNFPATALVEFLGMQGFDALFIDCEHGPWTIRDVEDVRRAADAVGMITFVRVENDSAATIVRYLDRGVDGIIVPHVETAAQARAIVKAVNDAELADRRQRYVNVLVESVIGIANLHEITQVDGLTGVFFGAVDLSTDMGHKGQPQHPEVQAAVMAGSKLVHDAGLMLGVPSSTTGVSDFVDRGGCYVYVHAQNLLREAANTFLGNMPRAG